MVGVDANGMTLEEAWRKKIGTSQRIRLAIKRILSRLDDLEAQQA